MSSIFACLQRIGRTLQFLPSSKPISNIIQGRFAASEDSSDMVKLAAINALCISD
jgi:hypothetical protein